MRHSGKKDVNNVPVRRRYNASEAVVEIRESLPLLIKVMGVVKSVRKGSLGCCRCRVVFQGVGMRGRWRRGLLGCALCSLLG